MITAISKDGFTRRVIFNDSIILVDSEDKLSFYLKDDKLKFELKFNFTFSNEGEELKSPEILMEVHEACMYNMHKEKGTEIWDQLGVSKGILEIRGTTIVPGTSAEIEFKSMLDAKRNGWLKDKNGITLPKTEKPKSENSKKNK